MADGENERVGERVRENDDCPPHILCGWGAVTLLPPPTWKIIRRPHTHSDRNSLYLYEARLCLSVPTPINPPPKSSSPHAAPCEQLSHWFTGSDGLEKFPVCPTTEEKNTHTGYSASASITLPLFYWESHLRAACSTHSLKELSCWLELGCLCVWVLVSFVETHHWEQSEGYFVMLQGRSWTENSRQPQEGQEGNQLQYQKIDTKQQRGYYVLYMWPYRHSSLTLWTLFTLRNDGQTILIIMTNYFRRFSWIFWCTSRRQLWVWNRICAISVNLQKSSALVLFSFH